MTFLPWSVTHYMFITTNNTWLKIPLTIENMSVSSKVKVMIMVGSQIAIWRYAIQMPDSLVFSTNNCPNSQIYINFEPWFSCMVVTWAQVRVPPLLGILRITNWLKKGSQSIQGAITRHRSWCYKSRYGRNYNHMLYAVHSTPYAAGSDVNLRAYLRH